MDLNGSTIMVLKQSRFILLAPPRAAFFYLNWMDWTRSSVDLTNRYNQVVYLFVGIVFIVFNEIWTFVLPEHPFQLRFATFAN